MKKIIHVNQHVIRNNKKNNLRNPVISVKTYKDINYATEVEVKGPCKIIYRPDKPLSCGAVCWIETTEDIEIK